MASTWGDSWGDSWDTSWEAGAAPSVVSAWGDSWGSSWGDSWGFGSSITLVADFVGSPLSGNTPLDVQFTDLSTGSPTSWLWDFGDGNTSTEQNPLHDYIIGGTYTVELTATNTNGSDSDTKTDYIVVSAVTPMPAFTPTIYGTLDFSYTRYGTLGFGDGELENG